VAVAGQWSGSWQLGYQRNDYLVQISVSSECYRILQLQLPLPSAAATSPDLPFLAAFISLIRKTN